MKKDEITESIKLLASKISPLHGATLGEAEVIGLLINRIANGVKSLPEVGEGQTVVDQTAYNKLLEKNT